MERYKILLLGLVLIAGCTASENREEVTTWYDDGHSQVKEKYTVLHVEGVDTPMVDGKYEFYHQDGHKEEEAMFKKGKLDGLRKLFNKSGSVMIEESYRENEFHGPYRSYHDNGKTREKGEYIDGKMEGDWLFYHENGTVKEEVKFKNGVEDGPYKKYYDTGQLRAEGAYTEEKETGEWRYYYPSGALEEIAYFKDGWNDGLLINLAENGDTLKKITYANRKLVIYLEYEDNKVVKRSDYRDKGSE